MIELLQEKLMQSTDLTIEEAKELFRFMTDPDESEIKKASLLTALKIKEETPEEIAGFALSMRTAANKIGGHDDAVDVCGTGGDKSGSFNISTAVSFVLAGGGVKVAKHGNRSITSKSGSADVLAELGVDINFTQEQSGRAIDELGISFLFAPLYHPAMKHIGPVRKQLGFRTIFNMLGPVTNPASVKRQLIGTFNNDTALKLSKALPYLNQEHVCFACTDNRYDEVFLSGEIKIFEYRKNDNMEILHLDNEYFGYPLVPLDDIKGGTPKKNAILINEALTPGNTSPHFYTICANAAVAFYVSGKSSSIKEGARLAEDSINSGNALSKIEQLKSFGDNK